MGKILQFIGGFFVFFVLVGVFVGGEETSTDVVDSQNAESSESRADYVVRNVQERRGDFGNNFITGVIENQSGGEVSYIQVEINLYNNAGVQVGSTMANTNNLAAGGRWQFEAIAIEDYSDFEIQEVSGF